MQSEIIEKTKRRKSPYMATTCFKLKELFQMRISSFFEVKKSRMKEKGRRNKDIDPLIGSKGHVSAMLSVKGKLVKRWLNDSKTSLNSFGSILG